MNRSSARSRRYRSRRKKLPGALWANALIVIIAVVAVIAVPTWEGLTASGDEPAAPRPVPTATLSASPEPDESPFAEPEPTASADPSVDAATALAQLAALPSVPGTAAAKYERSAFGDAWYDQDRNGCDTRNDILGRDLIDITVKDNTNGCKVLTGTLLDPYTGETIDFVSGVDTSVEVQIDHVVPLSWAWKHGAEYWTLEERRAFANDPGNLLAVWGPVNQSKSDSGPDRWMPPAEAVHCEYVAGFVGVLAEWELGVTTDEESFMRRTLEGC